MENLLQVSEISTLDNEKVVDIKKNQGFNESNLMTLPFISLKRKKEPSIDRTWIRDGKEVNLKVVGGSEHGCPTIHELDVLMALFRIQSKNMDSKLILLKSQEIKDNEIIVKNQITNIPKKINFTYRGLAKELGLKGFGKSTKERLENSIKCLNECTIYSTLSMRDQELGEYIIDFDGVESSRILKNYRAYNLKAWKMADKKLLDPAKIEEYQSVEIDDFIYKNLSNNFLKLYDYDIYTSLKSGVAKKMQLILSQWSYGNEKFIKMQTLHDYIGLESKKKADEYYNSKITKTALEELVKAGFIEKYSLINDGVNFIFSVKKSEKDKGLDKYTTDAEIVCKLKELGFSYDDITKYCRLDTMGYIAGLLRYADYREKKGQVKDKYKLIAKGLPYNKYDVSQFILE